MFILEWLKWCFRKKEKKMINLENVLDTLLRKTIQNDSKFVIRIYIYTYICLKWRHIKYSNILRVGGKTTGPLIYIYIYIFFFFLFFSFFFFAHTTKHAGSYFSNQASNPRPLQGKHSLNHWTAGEVLGLLILLSLDFTVLLKNLKRDIHCFCRETEVLFKVWFLSSLCFWSRPRKLKT